MPLKVCSICGNSFACGFDDREKACWCTDLPPIMPMDPTVDCRCPTCLRAIVKEKIGEYVATINPKSAPGNLAKDLPKSEKLVEGIDYYINEAGNYVFTAWYHLRRGYCCQNGCKHCPYGFVKPDPSVDS